MTKQLVIPLNELKNNEAKRVIVEGVAIALVRTEDGTVHAIGDTCSHGQISLSEGFVEDGALECWAHGSAFSLTTGIPKNLPAFEPVPVYSVTVEDGNIYIDPTITKETSQ